MGRGQGRGWGCWPRQAFSATGLTNPQHTSVNQPGSEVRSAATTATAQTLDVLRLQATGLQRTLDELRSRIAELEMSTLDTAKKVPE